MTIQTYTHCAGIQISVKFTSLFFLLLVQGIQMLKKEKEKNILFPDCQSSHNISIPMINYITIPKHFFFLVSSSAGDSVQKVG